jgi:predicted porin
MNKKVLALAVAATLAAPLVAQADVKFSGVIQAEIGAAQSGKICTLATDPTCQNLEDVDRVRVTKDTDGALSNAGPNRLTFDIDEKLGNGLVAFARYQSAFSTAANAGLTRGQDSFIGIKGESFYGKFGRMESAYKVSKGLVDPFAGTSIQARGTAGGMTGSTYLNKVAVKDASGNVIGYSTAAGETNHHNLTHSGYLPNVLEVGGKFGGFSLTLQGVIDETDDMDGAGTLELRYTAPNFVVYASAAYLDFKDGVSNTVSSVTGGDDEDSGAGNWKVGGNFTMGPVKLGLQYEDAELGTMNNDKGQYIMGSADFKVAENVLIGGWVAGYMADADEEDALNWSLGIKYLLSKRTLAFGGYRQVDSDNDFRDENVFGVGLRHSF